MISKALGLLGIALALFGVLFLGGLFSAWWEIRNERRQGLTPTRPGWEVRAKKRAVGGTLATLKIAYRSRRTPFPLCWCGVGPLAVFPDLDGANPGGLGCTAWEAGHPLALIRHDAAGGYARTAS